MTEYYWHVHHEQLFEELTEPIERRIEYIKASKPKEEVETRLRLVHPVDLTRTAKLREAYAKWQEAYAKWQEAYAKREEAYAKREEAYAKREEAYAKWQEAVAKLKEAVAKDHKNQCPNCPWDGHTIFPEARR